MKNHPIIKFILILLVSAACGAAFSIITISNYDIIESVISRVNAFLGQYSHVLHIGVCLVLSLIVLFRIMSAKRRIAAAGPDPDDGYCDKIEKTAP